MKIAINFKIEKPDAYDGAISNTFQIVVDVDRIDELDAAIQRVKQEKSVTVLSYFQVPDCASSIRP